MNRGLYPGWYRPTINRLIKEIIMKKSKKAAVLLITVLIISLFTGCYMFMDLLGIPMTIEVRLMSFAEALGSGSALQIMPNFITLDDIADGAPELNSGIQANVDTYWDSFDSTHTFTITGINSSDPSNVTAVLTEYYNGTMVSERNAVFEMWENPTDSNFKIQSFSLNGSLILDRAVKF